MKVDGARWQRRQRRDARAVAVRAARRMATNLRPPLAPWQMDWLVAHMLDQAALRREFQRLAPPG